MTVQKKLILVWVFFLQEVADKEIAALPRDSCPVRIRNRCVMTSRPRGVKRRWRLSRIVFRYLADHNQMSGILRARWWLGIRWKLHLDWIIKNFHLLSSHEQGISIQYWLLLDWGIDYNETVPPLPQKSGRC